MPANKSHPLFKVRFTFTQGSLDRPNTPHHIYRMLHAKNFLEATRCALKEVPACKPYEQLSKVSVQQVTIGE